MDACHAGQHPTFIVQSKIGKSPHYTTNPHSPTPMFLFHFHHLIMPLSLDLLSHPLWASRMMAGIITVLHWRSELSEPYVFSDPRLHHLSGCAGLAQGHGFPQHHAVRVTACPGHLSPLHGLLSHTQSKYQKKTNISIIEVTFTVYDAALPQVSGLVER